MTYLWQKCKHLPNPRWFIPAVIGIMIFFLMICVARGETMDLTKAVIHHSASGDVSATEIDRWHKQNTYVAKDGTIKHWSGIGYHWVIRENGDIEKGRLMTKQGAHAKGRNHYVGICLTGHDKFTAQQYASLIRLLQSLRIKHIEPHHEECPGPGLDLDYIRRIIK